MLDNADRNMAEVNKHAPCKRTHIINFGIGYPCLRKLWDGELLMLVCVFV